MRRLNDAQRRKLDTVVQGVVADTLNAHPDYVTRKGRVSLANSLGKRLSGQLAHLVAGEGRPVRTPVPRASVFDGARALFNRLTLWRNT